MSQLRTRTRILHGVASVASYIFHPVFMPTIMTLALYKLAAVGFAGVSTASLGNWVLIIGINTILFPVLGVLLLKGLGFINSIHMRDPKERIVPLMISMVCYFWAYNVFKNIDSPFILKVLMLGNFWGIIALFMVNIFFKISMHTMAAGGMIGIVIVLMFISPVSMMIPLFVAMLIAGIMGTARLILGAHRTGEVWLGYALGILVMVAAYFYLV